ncbi:hypothetical protein KGP17_10150 [Serratia sp. JSRIV001]|uniref:hypothetical protein n=1 Tax=Serratia sp. JSRIV001 TaxID=2831893 RepID=UPI00056205CA|nr:hypothetical protein [Serratia sp. JSRIV001]UAN47851.1 hypothetical protein KGP17_10150 [Serratia sp. JSRIV001]
MLNTKRWLIFVLEEDVPFSELILKLEQAFGISLPYKDDKGRDIAKAKLTDYDVRVIDRIDRLDEMLCDDNHVIEFIITNDDFFTYEFECKIKGFLDKNKIKWSRSVWAPNDLPQS